MTKAAVYTVNQSGDNGDLTCDATCTLRDAVDDANTFTTDDVINFDANISTVTLTNEITINNKGKLTINGRTGNPVTIDGGTGTNRIFFISGATVALRNLKLTGGGGTGANAFYNNNGGAIYDSGGPLTLDHVWLTGNGTNGGAAGGIFYFNTTNSRIIASTFSANSTTSSNSCGGFFLSGGSLTVIDSTFTGNGAGTGGGFCTDGDTVMRNVTISDNTSAKGGGGFLHQNGSFSFGNSIVAGNSAATGQPEIININGLITSAGNNLVGDSAGDSANTKFSIAYQPTDLLDTPPLLGGLQNNGGTTPTMALTAGSPAIDKGSNSLAIDPSNNNTPFSIDQRNYKRIIDGDGDGSEIVDIGAYEYNSISAAGVLISGKVTARSRGAAGVLISLTDADGVNHFAITNPFGYFRFKNIRTGETYSLAVISKQFHFAPKSVTVTEDLSNLDFAAQSE